MGSGAITRKVNRVGRLFSLRRGDRVVIVLVSKTSGLCASRVRIPSAAPFSLVMVGVGWHRYERVA